MSNKIPILMKIDKTNNVSSNVTIDNITKLGKYNFIAEGTIITKAEIGNYCSIAPYVKIGLGEHNYNNISTSVKLSKNPHQELIKGVCKIGNDVWIGTNAVILRGVTIGDGVVIGANAVVTKNIPAFAIVVGIPARILKFRFSNEKILNIKNSQWWNYDLTKAKYIVNKIENEK